MNSLKKNSARQESCKKNRGKKKAGNRLFLAGTVAAVLLLPVLGVMGWHYFPAYYAKFYLTRSALQTKGRFMDLWGKDKGDGDAYEDALKLVADEVEWNGHSVLVLPGGLGISWKEQRDEKNTFAQGNVDVYFLGAIREGVHYWADQENVVLMAPEINGASVRTSQDALKSVTGFSIIPDKKNRLSEKLQTLKKDTVNMISQSRIEFNGRDEKGVKIKASVPAGLFDSYLSEIGDFLGDGPGKDLKEWKTKGEIQEILFTIDKKLNITEIRVEGLADMSLLLESDGRVSAGGTVKLHEKEIHMNTKICFGNGQEGKRTFQIPELNITYHNEKFRLRLKLSGGYEGGRISAGALEYGRLSAAEGEPADGGLQEVINTFFERIGKLGFDFNK
ncbi:hypothetical protein [Clostridium sp. Marseille-P2415]|uniref:hypothetical protein n=1 Tax=Clostridium sp. Marseille-P2415 TaxID=1805471 RepID=UPI00098874B7|nr:hypothetical protein [Clostridium sp. Marseille-P2415]